MGTIFNKWKDATVNPNSGEVEFVIMNTSVAHEFLSLLNAWRVPYEADLGPLYADIKTLDYYYVMRHKEYYSNNGITAEMESEYYA